MTSLSFKKHHYNFIGGRSQLNGMITQKRRGDNGADLSAQLKL